MIEIDINDADNLVDAIINGIEQGIRRTRTDPGLGQSMRDGVERHFGELSSGGTMEAVDGSVSWTSNRAPVTLAERTVGYGEENARYPLLNASGQMKEGYTRNARFQAEVTGRGSIKAHLDSADPFAELKARRHHEGGTYLTTFPHLTAGRGSGGPPLRTHINFPKREFLFWDPDMAEGVKQTVARNIDLSLTEELASRGML